MTKRSNSYRRPKLTRERIGASGDLRAEHEETGNKLSVLMALKGMPAKGWARRLDGEIGLIYAKTGATIDVFDIGKIYDAGRRAYMAGGILAVKPAVLACVDLLRKDKVVPLPSSGVLAPRPPGTSGPALGWTQPLALSPFAELSQSIHEHGNRAPLKLKE